jgi:hypothetical protein
VVPKTLTPTSGAFFRAAFGYEAGMRAAFFRLGSGADAWRLLRYWFGRDADVRVLSPDAWLVLAVTLVWYVAAYLLNDSPSWSAGGEPGWLTWWDQSQYHKAAGELAHGELRPNVYWFGYPALGAIFYQVLPRQPFLVPDLAMVLAIVAIFYAAGRLYMSRIEAVLLVYMFIWFDSFLRDVCLVVPWNTLPAYTAFFVSIYLLILRPAPPRVGHFILCALLAGLAMVARPTEIAALGLIYAPALARLGGWKQRAMAAGWFGAIVAGGAAVTLLLNEHLYHALGSPYIAGERGKIQAANYGLKAYQFFCDSVFLTGDGALPAGTRPPSLFSRYPEFLFLLPGLVFLLRTRGWAAWGFVLASAFTLGFYLLYVPFDDPPYAWSYNQWHYVGWIFPWLGLATYLTFRKAWGSGRRWFVAMLVLPLAVVGGIGFAAVPRAFATPEASSHLGLTTKFENQIDTVTLTVRDVCRVDDVRLTFRRTPPFNGTDASTVHLVNVAVNGLPQRDMIDCMMSQENATYHFSFLAHGLVLHAGDEMVIQFQVGYEPEVARAELDGIHFAPGQALRDYFSR